MTTGQEIKTVFVGFKQYEKDKTGQKECDLFSDEGKIVFVPVIPSYFVCFNNMLSYPNCIYFAQSSTY